MKVKFFDFGGLQDLFFGLEFFGFLNQFISFVLQVTDHPLIIGNLPKQLSVHILLVEVLIDEGLRIVDSLHRRIITVAVLMVLKANSTVLNLFISASILFLSILLTKTWVR